MNSSGKILQNITGSSCVLSIFFFCFKTKNLIIALNFYILLLLGQATFLAKNDGCSFLGISHFSHVTKGRIFKSFNLRKKADRNFHFPEKPFQAPKIIFKSHKLIGQKWLSYGHLLKEKRLKFTFLRESTFQVLVCGVSPLKKT